MAEASGQHTGHPGAALRGKTARFLGLLRENGFDIGLAELRDTLRLLAGLDLSRPRQVEQALACLLCGRRSDWQRFGELFAAQAEPTAAAIRAARPPKEPVDPWRPLDVVREEERAAGGPPVTSVTVFLAGVSISLRKSK